MKNPILTFTAITLLGMVTVGAQSVATHDDHLATATTHVLEHAASERGHEEDLAITLAADSKMNTKSHLKLAQAGGGGRVSGHAFNFTAADSSSEPRTLIIPQDLAARSDFKEMEEDLAVMAHILGKATTSNRDNPDRAMGIFVRVKMGSVNAVPQNLYIEGHGAVFSLLVDFPLQPMPDQEANTSAAPPVRNEWEEARREMAQPGKRFGEANPFGLFDEDLNRTAPLPFNAEKVEQLKQSVVAALKHAANIRGLKADETITVIITGSGGIGGLKKAAGNATSANASAARLFIRARKADAEAFQTGKLDATDFGKKVCMGWH